MSEKRMIPRGPAGKVIVTAAALVLVTSFGCRDPEREPVKGKTVGASQSEDAPGDVVRLSGEELEEHGVSFAVAGPGAIDASMELSGVIRPNGDRLAHIVPRFPGVIREVRQTIGDSVKAGNVLAVVESSVSLARYELQTMIDGVVIDRHATIGEAVDSETKVFVIADLRNVWVDLSVFQKDLSKVRVGQTVRISAEHFAEEQSDVEAKITYIAPVVDEVTRTAVARAVLPNPAGYWRPGMFVTGKLLDPSQVAVAVPEAAIQTVEGRTVVFVETEEGLKARPVAVGRRGETLAQIVSGLEAGERYAAAGTFLLKAELGKGAAEHEH